MPARPTRYKRSLRSPGPDSVIHGGGSSLAAALRPLDDPRVCAGVLGAAIVASAALSLWLTRGTSFFFDELIFFAADRGLDPEALLSPHNGHLVALPRAVYAVLLELTGPSYFGFRILQAAGIAVVAAEVYAFARPRIGPAPALVPSLSLLFLGSAWAITLSPLGLTHVLCVATGLGALLCLERGGRRADLAASLLLAASVASFSAGLAFLGAGAAYVLLGADRVRRAWVFAGPLVLYGAWFIAASDLETEVSGGVTGLRLSNVLLIPGFAAEAAATAAAALTGLSFDFTNANLGGLAGLDPSWGGPLAVLLAVAVADRLRRGGIPRMLWALLVLLGVFWASGGVVTGVGRLPDSGRYVYVSAVGILLLAVEVARGSRVTRGALAGLFAVLVFALGANLIQARNGGRLLRAFSEGVRVEATAIELARQRVDPGFIPEDAPLSSLGLPAGDLLAGMDRHGYLGVDPDRIRDLSPTQREVIDRTLADALGLRLAPAAPAAGGACRAAPAAGFPVAGEAVLLRAPAGAVVAARRFSAEGADVGTLPASGAAVLDVPPDRAPARWRVFTRGGAPLAVCAPPAGAA